MSDQNQQTTAQQANPHTMLVVGWLSTAIALRQSAEQSQELFGLLDRSAATMTMRELAKESEQRAVELADHYVTMAREYQSLVGAIGKREEN